MLALDQVRCEQFAACLDQDFDILFSDGSLAVKLVDAKEWAPERPALGRRPFNLTFRAARNLNLPQGIYKIRNAKLGEMEVFLVQIAVDENSSTFEAVFN